MVFIHVLATFFTTLVTSPVVATIQYNYTTLETIYSTRMELTDQQVTTWVQTLCDERSFSYSMEFSQQTGKLQTTKADYRYEIDQYGSNNLFTCEVKGNTSLECTRSTKDKCNVTETLYEVNTTSVNVAQCLYSCISICYNRNKTQGTFFFTTSGTNTYSHITSENKASTINITTQSWQQSLDEKITTSIVNSDMDSTDGVYSPTTHDGDISTTTNDGVSLTTTDHVVIPTMKVDLVSSKNTLDGMSSTTINDIASSTITADGVSLKQNESLINSFPSESLLTSITKRLLDISTSEIFLNSTPAYGPLNISTTKILFKSKLIFSPLNISTPEMLLNSTPTFGQLNISTPAILLNPTPTNGPFNISTSKIVFNPTTYFLFNTSKSTSLPSSNSSVTSSCASTSKIINVLIVVSVVLGFVVISLVVALVWVVMATRKKMKTPIPPRRPTFTLPPGPRVRVTETLSTNSYEQPTTQDYYTSLYDDLSYEVSLRGYHTVTISRV